MVLLEIKEAFLSYPKISVPGIHTYQHDDTHAYICGCFNKVRFSMWLTIYFIFNPPADGEKQSFSSTLFHVFSYAYVVV